MGGSVGFSASVAQASTFLIVIWPDASSAQNSMAAVSAEGSTVWVLIRRLNSSCSRSTAFVVLADFHWLGGSRVKVKSRSPASSRLSACDRETVRRRLAAGGWTPYRSPERPGALAGHGAWLAERFRRHRGNADVVRQELAAELGIAVSLRTVERAVEPLRRELAAEALATVRFETPPGRQLQIDFGERGVRIGEEVVRVYLFVATLGYSRRVYVRAFRHERQSAWFEGLEGAFHHFGGLPAEVLLDNAR